MDYISKFESLLKLNDFEVASMSSEEYHSDSESNPEIKVRMERGESSMPKAEEEDLEEPYGDYYGTSPPEFGGKIPTMPHMPRLNKAQKQKFNHNRLRRRLPGNPDYELKESPEEDSDILNLDCASNRRERIEDWSKKISLLLQTNNISDVALVETFIEYKMKGNVLNWWLKNADAYKSEVYNTSLTQTNPVGSYMVLIEKLLINEFVGIDEITAREISDFKTQQDAKYILDNIQLCNICHFENFFCEYEKFYYRLSVGEQVHYLNTFFNKFPPLWAEELEKKWTQKPPHITQGIAGKARLVRELIQEKCRSIAFQKESKIAFQQKPCCDSRLIDIPGKWGCTKYTYRKSKSKQKKYKRKSYMKFRRVIPRYRKPKNNSKRPTFRRKRSNKPNNDKNASFCPKGKKSCKCWVCKEEGHYANECPNRKQQAQKLEALYAIGLEPIESEVSDNDSLYEVEFKVENAYFYSDPGSEWEKASTQESSDEWKE